MSDGAYCSQCGEWLPDGGPTFKVILHDRLAHFDRGITFCRGSCLGIFVEDAGHITLEPVEVVA